MILVYAAALLFQTHLFTKGLKCLLNCVFLSVFIDLRAIYRCNPSCKGELGVCRVNSPQCGSYPAEPSLVICASLSGSQLCSPLPFLHPSLCSQCHISPQVTLCLPNNVRAPSGLHQHPTPPALWSTPAVSVAFKAKVSTHGGLRFINTNCRYIIFKHCFVLVTKFPECLANW